MLRLISEVILTVSAGVVMALVFCKHRRFEPFFILSLAFAMISFICLLIISSLYYILRKESYREFIYTNTDMVLFCISLDAHLMFDWIFAVQYLKTSLSIPYQFQIGSIEVAQNLASPRNNLDSWKTQDIESTLAQTGHAHKSKNLVDSLRNCE